MQRLDSTAISEVSYEPRTHRLSVRFRETGKLYLYYEVPESLYRSFLAAPSAGAFFNEHIRDRYRFTQLAA